MGDYSGARYESCKRGANLIETLWNIKKALEGVATVTVGHH